jgi:NADH-quinone oxidoreductase subunit N
MNVIYDIIYYMAFSQKFEFYFFVIFFLYVTIFRVFNFVSFTIIAKFYNLAFFVMLASSLNAITINFSNFTGGNSFFVYETAIIKFLIVGFWFLLYTFLKIFFYEEYFGKDESKLFCLDIALCGALYLVSANNLLEIFLGLELLAFPTYTIIGLEKTKAATEAALKYFIYSVYGSLLLVLSFIVLFMTSGQVSFNDFMLITNPFSSELAIILFTTAFMVKLGVGPFYHWAPPVYQAVSSSTFVFISVISKVPLLVAFIYLSKNSFLLANSWSFYYIVTLLLIGSFMSAKDLLSETNIRRILAYTSNINFTIGLLGYFINMFNTKLFLIYIILYLISNFSLYIWHLTLNSNRFKKQEISNISMFKKENPLATFMLNLSLIINSGLPPITIFFFKLLVIGGIGFSSTQNISNFGIFLSFFILLCSLSSYNAYFKIIKNVSYQAQNEIPDLKEEKLDDFNLYSFAFLTTTFSVYIFFVTIYFI